MHAGLYQNSSITQIKACLNITISEMCTYMLCGLSLHISAQFGSTDKIYSETCGLGTVHDLIGEVAGRLLKPNSIQFNYIENVEVGSYCTCPFNAKICR